MNRTYLGATALAAALAAAAPLAAQAAEPPPEPRPVDPVDTGAVGSTTISNGPAEPRVDVTWGPSNSVVGDYSVDMASLDADGNGQLSRDEAGANATLAAEFDAVDNNRDGVLDADELKDWTR